MIKNERLDQILSILKDEKYSSADRLAKKLFVSTVTVRRDLKKLEQDGFVNICYGGVSLAQDTNRDVPLEIRENFNNTIKSQLAKEAAGLIANGSTVFLDASSTVSYILDYLRPEQNITVITNGMKVLSCAAAKHIKAYCVGGRLINNSMAFTGAVAVRNVADMHADYMFFSSQGLSTDGNITDYSEGETELRRAMMAHSSKKYFVCDNSKLGKVFLFKVCHTSELDGVICDCPLPFSQEPDEQKVTFD